MDIDGFELVVSRLESGSVLNYRNIFIPKEKMFLTARCHTRANLLILNINEIDSLASLDKELDSKILRFINKLYKNQFENRFLIDLIPPYSNGCIKVFNSNQIRRRTLL